ncbi:MAG: carbon-nitrogen hydrolase family protein [Propionibacteriaceae bacterium]
MEQKRLATVAVAQIPVTINDVAANLATVDHYLGEAAAAGARLIVFPECALTGYLQTSLAECQQVAIDPHGPELTALASRAAELDLALVIGYLERGGDGQVYNTATLLAPDGGRGDYHKVHLPFLGADRFVTPGTQNPVVVDTPVGPVGLSICYDLRFPEWARCLSLAGAAIMAHPTNWAVPSAQVAKVLPPARAFENSLFVLASNRGDVERGTEFAGLSSITSPMGEILASAGRGDALLLHEVDVSTARLSKMEFIPGEFELDFVVDRRPELYGRITEKQES